MTGARGATLAAALAVALGGCRADPGTALRVRPLSVRPPDPAPTVPPTAWVEVASDPEAREQGLMGRPALPRGTGLLFVYPESEERRFWMKGCAHPISAAFLDAGGRVLTVVEMTPGAGVPDDALPKYASGGPAKFVLEMGPGWFREAGVEPGERADLTEAIRGVRPR